MSDNSILWRAQTYALLARLLVRAPDQYLLDNLAAIQVTEPDSPMGQQWLELSAEAAQTQLESVEREYQQLFIGVTQGELVPYASFYLTGFLMEEPLALLRADLQLLGLERQQDTAEPEDHATALFDVMRLLLNAEAPPLISPELFFQKHLKPWIANFFDDMQLAKNAVFYQSLARFAIAFVKLETTRIPC